MWWTPVWHYGGRLCGIIVLYIDMVAPVCQYCLYVRLMYATFADVVDACVALHEVETNMAPP